MVIKHDHFQSDHPQNSRQRNVGVIFIKATNLSLLIL